MPIGASRELPCVEQPQPSLVSPGPIGTPASSPASGSDDTSTSSPSPTSTDRSASEDTSRKPRSVATAPSTPRSLVGVASVGRLPSTSTAASDSPASRVQPGTGVETQPLEATQLATSHGLVVRQVTAVPGLQTPARHTDADAQAVLEPHSVPSTARASEGQSRPAPSQTSARSHGPAAARQLRPTGTGAQRPSTGDPAATLHAWQSDGSPPPQGPSQQKPSTHGPPRQSTVVLHAIGAGKSRVLTFARKLPAAGASSGRAYARVNRPGRTATSPLGCEATGELPIGKGAGSRADPSARRRSPNIGVG